jgi:cytochrome oxidase assembly protein ShyY1
MAPHVSAHVRVTQMISGRKAIAAAAGLILCGIAIALGNWQSRRADAKAALERQWKALDQAPTRLVNSPAVSAEVENNLPAKVRVRGHPEHESSIWLDNRIVDGRPGFYLLTPLRLANGAGVVLVLRGWVARDASSPSRLPSVNQSETMDIEGIAIKAVPRVLELRSSPRADRLPAVWQNLDLDAARAATRLPLAGFVVQQISSSDDGLVRRWPQTALNPQKNRGYAFQWYAIATVIGALTVFFTVRDLRRSSAQPAAPPAP